MLSVCMSGTPILHTVSFSFSPSLLYLPSSVCLSSIFSCLLLHYHINTLAHTLGKKKKGMGGEMHE